MVSVRGRWNYERGKFIRGRLRRAGVEVSRDAIFLGAPIIRLFEGSRVIIGSRTTLVSVSQMTALGVNHPVILRTLSPNAVIQIGEDVGISGASICAATRVEIDNECLLGANVTICDTDFHPVESLRRRYEPMPSGIEEHAVRLLSNVFIGAGSIILKGVTIGKNSVVGAHSVVTTSIPDNCIAAGNPAKVLRRLSPRESRSILRQPVVPSESEKYWDGSENG